MREAIRRVAGERHFKWAFDRNKGAQQRAVSNLGRPLPYVDGPFSCDPARSGARFRAIKGQAQSPREINSRPAPRAATVDPSFAGSTSCLSQSYHAPLVRSLGQFDPICPSPRQTIGAPLWRVQMQLNSSCRQDFILAAGVASCIGVYVVFAFAFHWMMQPTVSENYGIAAYKPPPATIVVYREGPFVPPPPSKLPPSAVAEEPPASAAFAAALPEVAQKPAPAVQAPKKHVARTPPRREATVRDRRNSWDRPSASPYEFRSVW